MLAQPYPRLSHYRTIVWQARGVELVAGVRGVCVCVAVWVGVRAVA
jgi:hypothetical protein